MPYSIYSEQGWLQTAALRRGSDCLFVAITDVHIFSCIRDCVGMQLFVVYVTDELFYLAMTMTIHVAKKRIDRQSTKCVMIILIHYQESRTLVATLASTTVLIHLCVNCPGSIIKLELLFPITSLASVKTTPKGRFLSENGASVSLRKEN